MSVCVCVGSCLATKCFICKLPATLWLARVNRYRQLYCLMPTLNGGAQWGWVVGGQLLTKSYLTVHVSGVQLPGDRVGEI